MIGVLTIRKDAERDIAEAFQHYQEKREGLGHDFLLCIEEALEKLQRSPLTYKKYIKILGEYQSNAFPIEYFI